MTNTDEKTFPALPPPGRGFAGTWWGHAWLRALEDGALDGEQVRQGRRYARRGAVGAVSVRPGGLTAVVRDPDGTAHRTDVLVQRFTEAEWDRVVGLAAAESGYIAALLDREVPPEPAEDAAEAGVALLPGIGDLDPRCDCGEWDHCPHTVALCHQVARLLDQDPFVLLLLRGRAEADLVDALEKRSSAEADAPDEAPDHADEGVPAAEAFAARAALPPLRSCRTHRAGRRRWTPGPNPTWTWTRWSSSRRRPRRRRTGGRRGRVAGGVGGRLDAGPGRLGSGAFRARGGVGGRPGARTAPGTGALDADGHGPPAPPGAGRPLVAVPARGGAVGPGRPSAPDPASALTALDPDQAL